MGTNSSAWRSHVQQRHPPVLRPNVGARVQLLRQEGHGLDGSLSLFYKAEGFTEAEGELEMVISLAHAFEAVTVGGNLAYGQDPEGNERDGEVRMTVYRYRGHFSFGFDVRGRFALGSQRGRAATVEPTFDALGGPTATWVAGPIALFAEVGPSAFKLGNDTHLGLAAFGGIGTAF